MNSEDLNESGFEALAEAMKRQPRPLALLGAGTSVDCGYPDWNGLLLSLRDRARGKIGNKYQTFLDNLNDPAWQAEEYRRLIGEHEFCSLIASEFSPKGTIGPVLRAIVHLQFRHIMTTNYDSSIERAFEEVGQSLQVVDWMEGAKMRRFFLELSRSSSSPYLIYLHGRFYDPVNIILTESSYANRYVRSDDAQRKLFAILITQPVVFIGFSVNDPDLNHLMREANARLGAGNPQHFALIGYEVEEQRALIKNRFEGKYGIQPVFYPIREVSGKKDHGSLVDLLHKLYETITDHSMEVRALSSWENEGSPSAGEYEEEWESPAVIADWVRQLVDTGNPQSYDSLDQQKGKWGGLSESNDRRLRVENVEEYGNSWCTFDLVVEAKENATAPLSGMVVFHLHQTFHPDTVAMLVVDGKAKLTEKAYGSFTVGVEADDGATKLELDLSEVEDFPEWFRKR